MAKEFSIACSLFSFFTFFILKFYGRGKIFKRRREIDCFLQIPYSTLRMMKLAAKKCQILFRYILTACLSTFCFICCPFIPTKFHFSSSVLLCSSQLVSGQNEKMKAIFSTTARFNVVVFEEIFRTNFGCFCGFLFPKIYHLLFLVASHVSLNPLPLISATFASYSCLLYLKNYNIYHFIVPSKFLFRFTLLAFG